MKKTLAVLTVFAVLGFAAIALAHGPGGGYGGHMGGYGYGGGMGGYGHMYGYGSANDSESKEFLEKTAGLRKELNAKRFDYEEAVRAGDEKKAEKIAKELDELSEKLYKEAPRSLSRGYGRGCW